jgi:hypothetical protein
VCGTIESVAGLGINKDLEPLVRAWRRAGGAVEVRASNHVRWTRPDGTWFQTGLTMNSRTTANAKRQIEHELDRLAGAVATTAPLRHVVSDGRGKWHVVDADGNPLANASGYPRTFSTRAAALDAAHA